MLKDILHFSSINTQTFDADWLKANNTRLDILRIDKIHPVVSGNKWFKLKYYLEEAVSQNAQTIGTFGGAYSNHIIATAYAAQAIGLRCIGVIRGERPKQLSHTLRDAEELGMHLHFVSREEYNNAEKIKPDFPGVYWISEGGYGPVGVKGAAEILSFANDLASYTHIVCAVGTGTMLAGLITASFPHQQVIGVSVLKNNFSIEDEVRAILPDKHHPFKIVYDYHFGGYAKHPEELLNFMRDIWTEHRFPTDIVYTSKALYAIKDMITKHIIPQGSKVLTVHCGGLQGNLSLRPGVLPFL
ncbi:pyridoxal-phosphate dependent enzyme [Danxiaibacter flavus]|uniref:Pyridoxal-phosphate dependent enzyme n=1 Tax=Danxiaibacter flavus TaxID=3049108 RepID=A0ABV3ZAL3_9BACT|nr:pyridoxal-phosphate dependent enzyme [Chitinophagaceae bacterium DXS]